MSKLLFDAYINNDVSLDIEKANDDKISLDIMVEHHNPLDIEDDYFVSKKFVQESDDMSTDVDTPDTAAPTDVDNAPDTSTAVDTSTVDTTSDATSTADVDNIDTADVNVDDTTTSTDDAITTVQEGFFSKEKRQEKAEKRKLRKIKYDPESKTIEIEDDAGEKKRVTLSISDERSLRKAIAKIDKELEKFSDNSTSENKKLLKERNKVVAELTELLDAGAYAGVSKQGQVVINITTEQLDNMSAKELNAILEHEKEHIRQFTRKSGVKSSDDPNMLLIDDASLKFIKDWINSEKGRKLGANHDRLDYELTADAASIRKYGYRKLKSSLNKLVRLSTSRESFMMHMNNDLRDIDKDFRRVEKMIHMVGDSNEDLSDEETRKIFKSIRDNLDSFRVAAAKTEAAMLEVGKNADSGLKAKIKKACLTIFNLFKESKAPYKYCSKYTENEIIKRLEPNERREAIRYLYDLKLNDYIKTYDFESMEEFIHLVQEYSKKMLSARIEFAKEYDAWYRSRKYRFIKEHLEYEFYNVDVVCEGYMVENLISAIMDDEVYEESYRDVGFGSIRAKIADAIGKTFRVSGLHKLITGHEAFTISSDDAVTTVEDLDDKCKVVSRGGEKNNKTKTNFAGVSYADAVDKIIALFKKPEAILEGFVYDVSRFDDTVYQEDGDDETKEILDETVEEATDTDKSDDDTKDEDDIEEFDNSDEEPEDSKEPEEDEDVEIDITTFGTDDSDVQNDFDPKDIEILNKLVAAESDAINDYFDAAKDCHDETLRRLFGDIGHEERFHLEQLLYSKSTLTGEKYEPRDPEVKKEYEELVAMGMDEDTAANTAIDKTYTAGRDYMDMSDDIEIEQEVASIYEQMLRDNIINDMIMEAVDSNSVSEAMGVFLETCVYQEEMMNSAYASKEMKSIPNPISLLLTGFKKFINLLIQLSHSLKESYTKNKMKRKAMMEWIKANGISGLFKSGISLYFYNPKISKIDITDPCKYVDMLYRMTVMIGEQCGIKVTTKHKTIKDAIHFNSIEQGMGILKRAMFTKTKVVVTDTNKDILARDFFGYSDTKINVNVKHGDEAPVIHDSDNAYNSLDILINVTKQYADISAEVLEQLQKLEGNPSSVFYKNRNLYNESVKNMKVVVNYFNKFITAIGHDMNTIIKLDNGLLAMTRERDSVEQSGGKWTGADIRTSRSTATADNTTGTHTKMQTDKATAKAKKKLEKAQRKMEAKLK